MNTTIYEGLKLGKGARREPVCPQTTSELVRYINSLDNDDFIDVGNVDVTNLTSLKGVFQYLNVKEIRGLQNWKVSKITDFSLHIVIVLRIYPVSKIGTLKMLQI